MTETVHPPAIESRYVLDLRALATDSRRITQQSIERLADEVRLGLAPNVHRYEVLARHQYVAHLASSLAVALEAYPGTDGIAVAAERAVDSYLVQHSTGRDDQLGRACRHAADRVLSCVQTTAREQAEAIPCIEHGVECDPSWHRS